MLEALNTLDTKLFLFLNGLHSDSFDGIMVWVSGKTTWWPFYLLLLAGLAWKIRLQLLPLLFFVILCVTLTDQVSVHLFKEVFERLRPCHEPALNGMVHIVNERCGGQYGFVSSHAANVFGIAMLLLRVFRRWWYTLVLIAWASLVAYSRVYLGVHYPGDILGGALLGLLIGFLLHLLYLWVLQKLPSSWNMLPQEQKIHSV